MAQGEFQRRARAVEADHPQGTGQIRGGAQHGNGVGGRAQADIPHYEFPKPPRPPPQVQLLDVKRLRLGRRADHGMKRLVFRQRADAVSAVFQPDELVIIRIQRPHDAAATGKSRSI